MFSRFHGTIDIDVPDPFGHFTEVVQNVIEHFSGVYGTEVRVHVDTGSVPSSNAERAN